MTIIVTGGSGFIGTNIMDYYLKKNLKIFNFDIKPPQKKEHVEYWQKVDVADYKDICRSFKIIKPKYIIHLAARTDLGGKDYEDYSVNVKSVENLIKICKECTEIKRVIFASTMLVNKTGHNPKNLLNYNANTLYGQSKVVGENIILNSKDLSADKCIIRPTSIWGEWFGEPYKNFFDFVLNGKYFHPGGNSCKKTFGYVGNSVYQIDKLLFADPEKINNKIFYIGDRPSVNISKWADEISSLAKVKKPMKIPLFFFILLAFLGDFLNKLGFKFPMTSYRLKNMTTDQVYNLDDTYNVCGNPPFDRKSAIKQTLKWISHKKSTR